jgi:GTPase
MNESLPPENDGSGNVEYKKMFSQQIEDYRINQLVTQATWRMSEGYKERGLLEAFYYIGVNDNGSIGNISLPELVQSIDIFKIIVNKANARIINSQFFCTANGNYAKIKIQKIPHVNKSKDLTIGLLGPTLCGKTSLVGYLSYGIDDDGNGNARECVFKHDHETDSGVTTSIKHDLIGFSDNKLNNYANGFIGSWEDIVKDSDTIINLIDMPGHFKYIKTTIFCLLTYSHDYICIMINANCSDYELNTLYFHIFLCYNLDIPFIIIINKIDLLNDVGETSHKITGFCKTICNYELLEDKIIPISIVNKHNMDNLYHCFNNLQIQNNTMNITNTNNNNNNVSFLIYDVLMLPELGTVVVGKVLDGQINVDDKLLLGPGCNNNFDEIIVKSIHKKQISNNKISKGEHGSLLINKNAHKKMMIVSSDKLNDFVNTFNIKLNNKSVSQNKQDGFIFNNCVYDNINIGAKLMAFTNNVYEYIEIINKQIIDNNIIIQTKFKNYDIQYIKNGSKIIINYHPTFLIGTTHIDRNI